MRRFANEAAVTEILAREGVEILHPEAMSFAEQVRLFARRRVVAGSLGSALHTALFAPPGRRVVALSPGPVINPTFLLVDALCGNAVSYLHQPGTAELEPDAAFGSRQALADPRTVADGLLRQMARMAAAPPRGGGFVGRVGAARADGRARAGVTRRSIQREDRGRSRPPRSCLMGLDGSRTDGVIPGSLSRAPHDSADCRFCRADQAGRRQSSGPTTASAG